MSAPAGADTASQRVVTSATGRRYAIDGHAKAGFENVVDAFARHFSEDQEIGASACVTIDGEVVVDLWGGYADAAHERLWQADTLCNAMSVTKAMTATCLHLLVDRGLLDLDAPVAHYWPEFGCNGKEGILVRWLTDQRAGLPVLEDDLWRGAIFDWEAMTLALARQAPIVEPGKVAAYHIRTSGFLIGEVVRRVSGRSLGQFFREEIAEPFGIDFFIGLPEREHARAADFVAAREGTLLDPTLFDPDSIMARAGRQMPQPLDYNSADYRLAEIPSSNGHGNARAVARFYAILAQGGSSGGKQLLKPETLASALVEQHHAPEIAMGRAYRQALGLLLNTTPGDFPIGPNPRAFGVHGMGGALGMADPDARMSFGYIENKMHSVMGLGPRAQNLVKAVYDAIS